MIRRIQNPESRIQKKLRVYSGFWILAPGFLFLLSGCFQTAQIYTAQHNYYQRNFDLAAQRLDPAGIPKRDALLALLEKGMALQAAGRYAESAEAWREAEPLMAKQDVFHVGEQSLSLLLDPNVLSYQPAPYEKPFLHALLCIDYLMLRDYTSARVEALKSLEDIDDRESIAGPIAFVRYIAAVAYESAGDVNDAYIEYKKIHESGVPGFLPTLIRMSATLGFHEDHDRLLAEAGDTVMDPADLNEAGPAVILFLGKSPRKVASEVVLDDDYRIVLPVFQVQANRLYGARLHTGADAGPPGDAIRLTSVESLAAQFSGKLFARELLREVLRRKAQKHVLKKVGDKVGSNAEKLLRTIFFFAKEADLRTWSSLPAQVLLLRPPAAAAGALFEFRYTDAQNQPVSGGDTVALDMSRHPPIRMFRAW